MKAYLDPVGKSPEQIAKLLQLPTELVHVFIRATPHLAHTKIYLDNMFGNVSHMDKNTRSVLWYMSEDVTFVGGSNIKRNT